MKIVQHITIIIVLIIGLASCGRENNETGRVYMPDMSYSRAYEFYSTNPNYANGITAQAPVAGTIARGNALPNHLMENDTNAFRAHKFNGELSLDQIAEGGRLYNIHCGVCHGNNLDGNGPLYNGGAGKYPAAPANFKDAKYLNMAVGTMYHAIMYGKNLMGSYASQLDEKQRWMVLAYIKKTQAENGGASLASSFTVGNAAGATDTAKVDVKASSTATVTAAEAHATSSTTTTEVSKEPLTDRAKKALENKAKEIKK
jgi:mono/diheme cytochrome c family protein